jgi:hypothetical protein
VAQLKKIFVLIMTASTAVASLAAQAPQPLNYVCHVAPVAPVIDGRLDDSVWSNAPWTDAFVDITGHEDLRPVYRTRMKMLWDDHNLYIAAEMEEPDVHGTLTAHDSVIFHDDDFEMFLKPVPTGKDYFEFEMNALNTTWDLHLDRPYREGGKADNAWEAEGIQTAVAVQGTLNNHGDRDQGWTLEIALPLNAFASRQQVPMPVNGTQWLVNFSRVEWLQGHPREENWVWSPQGEVNMHIPERWGALTFRR